MTNRPPWMWYLPGVVLLALPGLFSTENRVLLFCVFGLGWTVVLIGIKQQGFLRPSAALALLVVSNTAFWATYLLWRFREFLIGPPASEGLHPFTTAVSMWLVAMLLCISYEGIVFVHGLARATRHQLAWWGLAGMIVQIQATLRTIYVLIQGV